MSLAVGVTGLAMILVAGILVLVGVRLKAVEAVDLVDVADRLAGLASDPASFDVEAATRLAEPRTENERALRALRRRFFAVALGLLLEVAGLAVAAEIPAPAKPRPPARAALRLTGATLRRGRVSLAGSLSPGALDQVRVVMTLDGRGTQTISRFPRLTHGRFTVAVAAAPRLRPLRSASYTITATGPAGATPLRLFGRIERG